MQGGYKRPTMSYVKTKEACDRLGIHPDTLRNWAERGIIKTIRTVGNHRLYNLNDYIESQKFPIKESSTKQKILYCRVSSSKQKEDLERQVEKLSEKYPKHKIYKEIASGINFQRKQLYRILDLCFSGMVEEVVVAHRDRLCRLAWDHFSWLFDKLGVRLLVDSDDPKDRSKNEELADDLMSIVHVFSCRHYGARRALRKTKSPGDKEKYIAETGEHDGSQVEDGEEND